MKKLLHLALLSSLITVTTASAEDKIGRLPDGRAYRTDSSGFRLTDQVADLEVAVKELQHQVISLEDELREKNALLSQKGAKVSALPKPASATERPASECSAILVPLQNRIAQLENSLANQPTVSKPACNEQTIAAPYQQEIQRLKANLETRPSAAALSQEISRRENIEKLLMDQNEQAQDQIQRVSTLSGELSEAKRLLKQAQEELEQNQLALNQRKERESQLLKNIDDLSAQLAERASAQAELSATLAKEARGRYVQQPQAETNAEPIARSTQKNFQNQLRQIQTLIVQRKDLLDSMKLTKRGVSVSAQPLVTSQNVSLDTLRSQVGIISTEEEAKAVRQGLTEISGVLENDITLLRRLQR